MPDAFPPDFFARPLHHTPRKPWKPLQGLLGACRWLVDRLARPAVIGTIVVLGWAVFLGCQLLATYQPPVAWSVGVWVFGFACGLWWRDRRRKTLSFSNSFLDETVEAKNLADAANDGLHVNTGEVPLYGVAPERPVELFDQDAQPAFHQGGVVPRSSSAYVFSGLQFPPAPTGLPQGVQVHVSDGDGLVDNLRQLITDRTPASSTGPEWSTCGRCGGRGWFDAIPDQQLPRIDCPDCAGTGGQWRQP